MHFMPLIVIPPKSGIHETNCAYGVSAFAGMTGGV